ncbi:hypothetical protein ACROYT_G006502 [Oculina patagonica]
MSVFLLLKSFSFLSSKKEKGDVNVTHLLFQEPIYTTRDQVFYPPADTLYDIAPVTSSHPQSSSLGSSKASFYPPADTLYDITPVTSSHPQSSSLGRYGDMSMYDMDGGDRSYYNPLLGPAVPPPSSGLRQTYSAMSELDYSSDD